MKRHPPSVEAWLRKAEHDLLNVQNNMAATRTPWDTVCYHAQQAAEKTFKALLIARGEAPPRTHDLVALLSRCAVHDAHLAALEADCRMLTVYGVGSRYPDDFFEPTEEDAHVTVAACNRIRAALLPLLTHERGDDERARA